MGAQPPRSTCGGWLGDEIGIKLQDIHWYPGRRQRRPAVSRRSSSNLPKGLKLTRVADKSLSDSPAGGGRDRLRADRGGPPTCFFAGAPRRGCGSIPTSWGSRRSTTSRTKVFSDHAHHRGQGARCSTRIRGVGAQSLQRVPGIETGAAWSALLDPAVSALSAAVAADLWAQDALTCSAAIRSRFGIEENRPTLEMFLRYTYEQGIAHRHRQAGGNFPEGHHGVGGGCETGGCPPRSALGSLPPRCPTSAMGGERERDQARCSRASEIPNSRHGRLVAADHQRSFCMRCNRSPTFAETR